MSRPRYLTKSRFKLGCECPAKLFYTAKKEYANQKLDDSFLLALAEGGFQVGELAKCYFPGGHDITTLDYDEAIEQTYQLLQKEEVIIYEAAIKHNNLFIRIDVLVKYKDRLDLIEVKAKSIDTCEEQPFRTKSGNIASIWKPYLLDAAFQKHVLSSAFPDCRVKTFLMLADKRAVCPTDGLNQKFRVVEDSFGRKQVKISETLSEEDLSTKILCQIMVDDECEHIFNDLYPINETDLTFVDMIQFFESNYVNDNKIMMHIASTCGKCEFYNAENDEQAGLKSGKKECWKEQLNWTDEDFNDSTIFDIWNFRKKDSLIEEGRIKISDVTYDDINPKSDDKKGVSASERQLLQVEKIQKNDISAWFDTESMKEEMGSWVWPLHFIDFETTMVAIPFNKGMQPYEGVAFQFSHHMVHEDGTIEHKGEYLNTRVGYFPNFDFIRNLKKELEHDSGTIFKYAPHENTFLNIIYWQLQTYQGYIPDKEALCNFIQSISHSTKNSKEEWHGSRDMVDMWDLVKRYYYNPLTNGSNSIKQVLPAILNSSSYLKDKYSQPLYGSENGIKSHNFTNWQWIIYKDNMLVDPYRLLPKLFQELKNTDTMLHSSTELKDGGAALTAYAKMQFQEMSDYEREEIQKALLKYCELDTFAMVMLFEGWREMIKESS